MGFDWREYLELAKDLAGQRGAGYTSSEAAWRSAVSRAYYSAFCWVRNYAEVKLGFQMKQTADDHRSLREHLKRRGKKQVASRLNRLREWRNACDYNDKVDDLGHCVSTAIEFATKIIEECR
jgi:uncharacterized protein (UPF0332 family)